MTNKHFVLPKIYLIGYTGIDLDTLKSYLIDTCQSEFLNDINAAIQQGIDPGEILCSFYAKACYASLTPDKNLNITKTRDIVSNVLGIIASGHGSVIEHCNLNFMITNCSRVFTHELVRHRAGTAFSQTSGRYVRTDELNIVVDPILEPVYEEIEHIRKSLENCYKNLELKLKLNEEKDFNKKKKLTSAIRRILPNGQANEIGVTLNLRSLRHTIEMRTSRHAEWEIRYVFNQIFNLVKDKYSLMFADASIQEVEGLSEITFANKKV